MNPTLKEKGLHNVYKDAVFISTHKFVGGPGSPGNQLPQILITNTLLNVK